MCYLQLSKHYLMRHYSPKCPDMRRPRYTPVAPVNAQGEYNMAKVGTLIPQFHWNQLLQGQLLLSQNLMISMSLRHLPQDLLLKMIWTPCMDSLILIQALLILSMIQRGSIMEILMVVHQEFDITT